MQGTRNAWWAVGGVLVVAGAVVAALFVRHERVQAELRDAYRADEHALTLAAAEAVQETLVPLYEGLRTMSRLPSVRRTLADGSSLDVDDRVTVQELYNNLASGVEMSEVYLVPRDLDPDGTSGAPTEPVLTYDELIVGRTGGEADHDAPEVPEIELFEYRLMRDQLRWLAREAPSAPRGLDVRVATGPEVLTCDNSHFDPRHPDDRARSGLVLTVPVYGPDDRLAGGVSGIVRTDVLRQKLVGDTFVLRDPVHDLELSEIGRDPSRWRSLFLARRPDPDVVYSETVALALAPGADDWYLWARRPDERYAARADVRSEEVFFRTSVVVVLGGALLLSVVVSRASVRSTTDRDRVAAVVEVAAAAAAGHLDRGVPESGNDAIGRLGRAIAHVLGAMRSTVTTTGEASARLDRAAEGLIAACRGIRVRAEQARVDVDEVHLASRDVGADVDHMARELGHLSLGIQEVASAAAHSAALANEGVVRVNIATGSAERLTRAGQDIEDTLRLIERITSATRMLAMNATIEAARAGIHGRGFAVVAREVGELARQTAGLTRTAHERVDRIREESDAVRAAVDELGHTVHRIADRQMTITESVSQQSMAAATVADGAERAAEGMARIREGMERVSESARATSGHAHTVVEASELVVSTAGELRSTRQGFVLPADDAELTRT